MPKTAVPSAPEQPQVAPPNDLLEAERQLLHKYQLHELPEEDEVPLESYYHRLQINLLHELTYQLFKDRTDFYCGGNMFLYYDLKQAEKVIQFVQGQRRRAPYKVPTFSWCWAGWTARKTASVGWCGTRGDRKSTRLNSSH